MSEKEKLVCDIIEKVGILTSIELNEEVDRIDATEDLFKAYDEYKSFCKKSSSMCNCGKKLIGIERA